MKVAAVLFVKNEVEDIAWWLSWHLSIGIDTIIVYDDYSSDGTWEVVNAAAKVYDIRPKRALSQLRFNERQAKTYMSALEEFQDEFDWLVYLDADEYVDILNGDDVHTFLSNYEDDIDGIALHWKCFGSNRHVEKPPSPNVFENYVTHSLPEFEMNQYVKSFFRPKRAEIEYINPHRFAVPGKYVTPNKALIEWQEYHKERPVAAPDWSVAVVRHYIIRSAEHYVEKSKRRSDIRSSNIGIGLFNAYDTNDLYEPMELSRIDAMYPYIYQIQHQTSLEIIDQIKANKLNKSTLKERNVMSENNTTLENNEESNQAVISTKVEKVSIHQVDTFFLTKVVVDKKSGRLAHTNLNDGYEDVLPVTFFTINTKPEHIFLIVLDNFMPIYQAGEIRVSKILAYKKIKIQHNAFALQSPLTQKIVTFKQIVGDDLIEYTECDRDWTLQWESLQTISIMDVMDGVLLDIAQAIVDCNLSNAENSSLDADLYADAFLAGLSILDSDQAKRFYIENNITIYPWLKKDETLSL